MKMRLSHGRMDGWMEEKGVGLHVESTCA